jgi:hypothetical protein
LQLYIFPAITAVAFVRERAIPAGSQPILRRGLVTDGLYVVVNDILRVVARVSHASSVSSSYRCFARCIQ